MEPGDESYERFGHDAIVVGDPNSANTAAFNFGVFDFDAPNFIGNFILGRMQYWLDIFQWLPTRDEYIKHNRSVWLQELNLAPAQRAGLTHALLVNSQDANKYYRYDYFRDNCTSRVRDSFDQAVGGQIKQQLSQIHTDKTFRWYTRIGMKKYWYLYAGLELSMGPATDRKLNGWEDAFLPVNLMNYLNQIMIDDGHGGRIPLILQSTTLYQSTRSPLPAEPPNWWWIFLLIGIGIGAMAEAAARLHLRKTFLSLAIFWSFICTLAGLFMIFAWTCTDHSAAYRNENLFLFNPLSLVLIVMLCRRKWRQPAMRLSMIILGIAVLDVILKLTPWFYQWNWELIALALPAHAGLARGLWILLRDPSFTAIERGRKPGSGFPIDDPTRKAIA